MAGIGHSRLIFCFASLAKYLTPLTSTRAGRFVDFVSPRFDSCTRAKQFARSSPQQKNPKQVGVFLLWRWRDREYTYRPRLKNFSSKIFGLATDSLILFANKMMLRRSIPARKPSSWLAHLRTRKKAVW